MLLEHLQGSKGLATPRSLAAKGGESCKLSLLDFDLVVFLVMRNDIGLLNERGMVAFCALFPFSNRAIEYGSRLTAKGAHLSEGISSSMKAFAIAPTVSKRSTNSLSFIRVVLCGAMLGRNIIKGGIVLTNLRYCCCLHHCQGWLTLSVTNEQRSFLKWRTTQPERVPPG